MIKRSDDPSSKRLWSLLFIFDAKILHWTLKTKINEVINIAYINNIDNNYETWILNSLFFFWHVTFSYILKRCNVLKKGGGGEAEILDEENQSHHGGGIVI